MATGSQCLEPHLEGQDALTEHVTSTQSQPFLPEEIMDMICARIDPMRGTVDYKIVRRTFLSLFRANKMCYRTARPHLYRVLVVESRAAYGHRQLLLTLLKDPELARVVRHIRLVGTSWKIRPFDYHGKRATMTAVDKETGLVALRRLQALLLLPTTRGDIWRGVEEQVEDSEIACIIAICPYVEVLKLPVHHSFKMSQIHSVVGHALSRTFERSSATVGYVPLALSHLEHLWFKAEDGTIADGRTMDCQVIVTMLSLPTLKVFQADKLSMTRMDDHTFAALSTLQTVWLFNVLFDPSGMAMLLRGCPNLQCLRLCTMSFHYSLPPTSNRESLGDILNRHGTSLRHLELSAYYKRCLRPGVTDIKIVGPLTGLHNLLSLKITELLLFGETSDDETDTIVADFHSSFSSLKKWLPDSLQVLWIDQREGGPCLRPYDDQILDLISDNRHTSLWRVMFPRYSWADELMQKTKWATSESTETKISLQRHV